MIRRFVPDNRRFVPTRFFWIFLLGLGAFLLFNQTLTFSLVPVANWAVMGGCILLSLALSVYFLVSLMLFFHDHDVSRAAMLIIGALILLFIGLTMLRICQNLSEASWQMEPWEDVALRYTHPARQQDLDKLQRAHRQATQSKAKGKKRPPRDWKSVLLVLGFFALCLVCNAIYKPYRLKAAREKGYNAESALNLLTGVAMLLLLVASIAKPVCLLWLGGLAMALFLLRLPKLGPVHAFLFTLLQPLALMDSGVSKIKYMTIPAPRRNIHPADVSVFTVGLNMARKEELDNDIKEDEPLQEALQKGGQKKRQK